MPTELSDSHPFHDLLHEKVTVGQVTYDNVEDVRSFGLDVKVGLEFGVAVNLTDTTSTVSDATFLSAPRSDAGGDRVFITDGSCG